MRAMIGIGDAGQKVPATRPAQAWKARAALVVGVGELHAVVLPPADGSDLERTRRLGFGITAIDEFGRAYDVFNVVFDEHGLLFSVAWVRPESNGSLDA